MVDQAGAFWQTPAFKLAFSIDYLGGMKSPLDALLFQRIFPRLFKAIPVCFRSRVADQRDIPALVRSLAATSKKLFINTATSPR